MKIQLLLLVFNITILVPSNMAKADSDGFFLDASALAIANSPIQQYKSEKSKLLGFARKGCIFDYKAEIDSVMTYKGWIHIKAYKCPSDNVTKNINGYVNRANIKVIKDDYILINRRNISKFINFTIRSCPSYACKILLTSSDINFDGSDSCSFTYIAGLNNKFVASDWKMIYEDMCIKVNKNSMNFKFFNINDVPSFE